MMFIAQLKTAVLITAAFVAVTGTSVVVATQLAELRPATEPAGSRPTMKLPAAKPVEYAQTTPPAPPTQPVKPAAPAVLCGNPVCGQTINSANCIHDCPQCRRVKTNCAHKYCPDCARQLAVCMICCKALGPEATALIDSGKSGDYASGKWSYHFVVVEKGLQTGYRQGFLKYDGREIFDPQPNDFIATPWGWMQWQDRELKAGNWFRVEDPRGWKPPGTPREARMKYRQLPDPATNPEILSNPPPSP